MPIFKNIHCIVLSLACMAVGIPIVGMKRSVPEAEPFQVANIQELHPDMLGLIARELWPKQRNILRQVSKFFQFFAGKKNTAALLGTNLELLDKTYLRDILDMLRTCVATNNVALHAQIINHPDGKVHSCYHRQMLLESSNVIALEMYKAIKDACSDYVFKNSSLLYNQVLFLKMHFLMEQRGIKVSWDNIPYYGKALANESPLKVVLKNICTNQPTAVAQYIEEYWAKNKTEPQPLGIQRRCITLLRYAAILKNTTLVRALLQTTPFQNHFQTDGVALDRMGIRYRDPALWELYWGTLGDVINYSNREIWHAIFTWAEPVMSTIFVNTSIVDDFLARGQYWQLRTLFEKPEHLIGALQTPVMYKNWSRVDGLSTVFDDMDIACGPIDNPEHRWIYFCKVVLHEAALLPAPLPGLEAQSNPTMNTKIKELRTAEPAIFKKLCTVCYRLLSGMIKSTIQLAIDDKSMISLNNYIKCNPSTRPLILSIAEKLRQEYRATLTIHIDLLLIQKIQAIDNLMQHQLV
jgi:hypothetical protein